MMIAESSGGTSARWMWGGVGRSVSWRARVCWGDEPANGEAPESSS